MKEFHMTSLSNNEVFSPTNIGGLIFASFLLSYTYTIVLTFHLNSKGIGSSCYFLAITLFVHSFFVHPKYVYWGNNVKVTHAHIHDACFNEGCTPRDILSYFQTINN